MSTSAINKRKTKRIRLAAYLHDHYLYCSLWLFFLSCFCPDSARASKKQSLLHPKIQLCVTGRCIFYRRHQISSPHPYNTIIDCKIIFECPTIRIYLPICLHVVVILDFGTLEEIFSMCKANVFSIYVSKNSLPSKSAFFSSRLSGTVIFWLNYRRMNDGTRKNFHFNECQRLRFSISKQFIWAVIIAFFSGIDWSNIRILSTHL